MSNGFVGKSFYSLFSQCILIVLGMASGILVARYLGPEVRGQATLITNLVQMLFMMGGLGLGSSFSYFIAKGKYEAPTILSFALVSSAVLGSLMILLYYVTSPLHKALWQGIDNNLLALSLFLTILYCVNAALGRITAAYDMIYAVNNIEMCKATINLVAVYFLVIAWNRGLEGYVYSLYFVAVVQCVLLLFLLRKEFRITFTFNRDFLRESFSYGIKSYALLMINFLNYRLDMFVIKYFRSDAEVGFYSMGVAMAELLWLIPNSTVAPLFNRIAGGQGEERSILTARVCRWSIFLLIAIAVFFIPCGKFFIKLLYGSEYLPAYEPFLCLLPGICLFPVYKLLIVDLAARGMPGYGTITSLAALTVNFGLNIVLVPKLGTVGAAISSSVSYSIMSLQSVIFFTRVSGMSLGQVFVPSQEDFLLMKRLLAPIGRKRPGESV